MQVNATQSAGRATATSAQARQLPPTGFQAMLEAAQQNLAPTGASITVTGAMPSSASATTQGAKSPAAGLGKTAAQVLAEYASKSVAERVRDAVLKDLGLSEADLAAMPPEQRAAIEEEIADRIRQALSGLTDPQAQSRQVALADPSSPSTADLLL